MVDIGEEDVGVKSIKVSVTVHYPRCGSLVTVRWDMKGEGTGGQMQGIRAFCALHAVDYPFDYVDFAIKLLTED